SPQAVVREGGLRVVVAAVSTAPRSLLPRLLPSRRPRHRRIAIPRGRAMQALKSADPDVFRLLVEEAERQEHQLEMIASENFASRAVIEAMGSVLTNKYAEGLPGKRYYGGCEVVDEVERLAQQRLLQLFGADHCNVQPHSGAQANMAAY